MKSIFKNQKNRIFSSSMVWVSIIALGIFMQSCDRNEDFISYTQGQKYLLEKSSFIGEEHNTNMQRIYEELSLRTKSDGGFVYKFTKENVVEIIKSKTEKVIVDRASLYANQPDKQYVEELVNMAFFVDKSVRLKNTNAESFADSIINVSSISPTLRKLVKDLIQMSDNYKLSIEQHRDKVNEMNKTAFATLNDMELEIFLAGSSVACASFEYWHTNINDWIALIKGGNIPRLKNGSESPYDSWVLEGMIGADVGGAVGGAIVGCVTGPGAVVVSIATSSGASVAQLVGNVWNYFFNPN
jgi:hypothetical protein